VPKPSVTDLQQLISGVVLPFYQVSRHTPLRFAPGTWENDAEHSWSLSLLACALAPHIDEALDIGVIAQFATVHDLVEVHAGDTSNFASDDEKATKDERERAGLQKLQAQLTALPWVCKTIEAYESQTSAEAKFVKSVDKILPLLFDYVEDGLFYRENRITLAEWGHKLQTQRQKASAHSGAFQYYLQMWELLTSHPEFFYDPAAQSAK